MDTSLEWFYRMEQKAIDCNLKPLVNISDWHNYDSAVSIPENLLQSAYKWANNKEHNYVFLDTLEETKSVIQDYLLGRYQVRIPLQKFSIAHNGTSAIHLSLRFLKSRDVKRVVIATPAYFSMLSGIRDNGMETIYYHLNNSDNFHIDFPKLFEFAKTQLADAVVLTNPIFSTGVEIVNQEIDSLFALAEQSGLWVVYDNTLGNLSWNAQENERLFSGRILEKLSDQIRLIYLESPSKKLFLNGLKHSVVFFSQRDAALFERPADFIMGGITTPQVGLVNELFGGRHDDEINACLEQNIANFRRNAELVENIIEGSSFSLFPMNSGFHGLVLHSSLKMHEVDFKRTVRDLIFSKRVAAFPLSHFGFYPDNSFGYRVNLSKHPHTLSLGLKRIAESNLHLLDNRE